MSKCLLSIPKKTQKKNAKLGIARVKCLPQKWRQRKPLGERGPSRFFLGSLAKPTWCRSQRINTPWAVASDVLIPTHKAPSGIFMPLHWECYATGLHDVTSCVQDVGGLCQIPSKPQLVLIIITVSFSFYVKNKDWL